MKQNLINFSTIQNEKNSKLNILLENKFSLIAKYFIFLLKKASKGKRKGLLIFKPEAPSLINQIDDKFIQYILRSIYDNYNDSINGIIWRIHMNELFNFDFIKGIFCSLNPTIDNLYKEYDKIDNLYKKELIKLHEQSDIYCEYMTRSSIQNVFRKDNLKSEPFWKEFNKFKESILKNHPRIKKLKRYIDNDYSLRNKFNDIVERHKKRFPEYIEINNKISEMIKDKMRKEEIINEKIKNEMKKENYILIEKEIKEIVQNFINIITIKIINGSINF